MRKYIIKTSLCFLTLFLPYAIIHSQDSILFIVNESVEVVQLTSDIYQHTSYVEMEMWGRVGANGLIIKSASGALMVDTPWNNAQTKTLIEWIRNEWKMEVLKVIVTHSHTDCAGGLKACQEAGIESYGLALTDEYLKQKKQPSLTYTFLDSLFIRLDDMQIELYYPGAAHAADNIVVWEPASKVLFAGCMVKALGQNNLGSTADADLQAWPSSVANILYRYSDAQIVVPGHGETGTKELISHTQALLEK